jgi:hypothetical protein
MHQKKESASIKNEDTLVFQNGTDFVDNRANKIVYAVEVLLVFMEPQVEHVLTLNFLEK